ncbi:MAG: LamG domain-containing protein [Planctomycetota bacterium]|jgi:hypothetical protein
MANYNAKHVTVVLAFIVSAASVAEARYSGGTGEPHDPYRITTAEDLNDIGNHVEDFDKCFVLVNDIDLAGYTGTQFNIIGVDEIDWFNGVFDGNGHKISNFRWSSEGRSHIGLFGYVGNAARVENLRMENADVNAAQARYIGALAGYNRGTIRNCYCTWARIAANNYSGGLVGQNEGIIDKCHWQGRFSGGDWSGGLSGWNGGTMTHCSATGDISGGPYAGGLAGRNDHNGVISDCSSTCSVSSGDFVGGLVSWNDGTIEDSHSDSNVSGHSWVGGLTGTNYGGVISGCYSSGNVSASGGWSGYVGGLVASNDYGGTITDCYSTANVLADDCQWVGGLVGRNDYDDAINNCCSAGKVEVTSYGSYVGGLIGENMGTLGGCCAVGEVWVEGAYVGGLIGRSHGSTSNCYARGNVWASGVHVGGLMGRNSGTTLTNCYSAGYAFGASEVGGLVGSDGWEMPELYISCFWNSHNPTRTGIGNMADPDGVMGRPTSELQTESTFTDAGWDFAGETANGTDDIWTICDFGGAYPRLWWQEPRVYYVDAVDGNDDNSGLTGTTALASIQAGIEAASACEIVLVYPAVYGEKLDYLGKAITVRGVASGEGSAIIEAPNDIGVSFYSGEDGNSVLENFVLRASETAVLLADASPSLRQLTVVDNNYGIAAYGDSEPDIQNCILWDNTSGDLYGCEARYSCVEQSGAGEGNIDTDPLFADANSGDYHLLSEYGRYWQEHGVWVFDEVSGGCIDGGDPNVGPWDEPMPNGDRINMGCYGGTAYASMSEWAAHDGIYPADRADDICPWAIINWPQAEHVVDHNIYFGSSLSDVNASAAAVAEHSEPNGWIVGDLELDTTYYWRIDGVNDANADSPWVGFVRQFTTNDGNAFDPYPADGQLGVSPEATLSWAPGCLADSHEVYFSTDFDAVNNRGPAAFMGSQLESTFEPFGLDYYTWYYWCVDEVSGVDVWNGKVWAFRTAYATMDPDLIVWYEFDETAGDIAHDASGHARDGYVDGQTNWDLSDGRFGGCLVFNDDTAVEVPTTVLSDVNDGITISVWLKEAYREDSDNWVFDTGSGDYHVQAAVAEQSTGQAMWRAGNDSNDVLRWDLDGADPGTLQDWHHWVFIKDESTGSITLYFDGILVALDDVVDSTLINVRNTAFKIGAVAWHANDFVGRMDDFQVWARALSESDILSLFRGGCIGRCEDLECSWSPTPRDGAVDVPPDAELQWKPGDSAVAHDVYFGTDEWAVSDANTVQTLGVYMGRQVLESDSFDPCGLLEFCTTYYWRVDEVNEPNVWKCHVWSFTTANFLVVEDFESYDEGTNRIWYTWEDGAINRSSSYIDLGTEPLDPVHGGDQCLLFAYENSMNWGAGYYAEAERPFGNPQDWTVAGVEALGLWFYGSGDNDVNDTEELYVAMGGSYDEVRYSDDAGRDMNDLRLAEWTEWNIPISEFIGVDPSAVTSLFVGFGDRDNTTVPGGDGVVYFDDIRLYPPRCVAELGPAADLNGDCAVDYEDLKIMAEQWLCSGSCTADLYLDNKVDSKDYAMLAASWLEDRLWP